MKKIIFILFVMFFFSTHTFSQSKFNMEFDSGFLAIKKDAGFAFSGTVSYKVSSKVTPYINYLYSNPVYSNPENENLNLRYDFSKVSVGAYYSLSEESITFSSVAGFSYLFFDNFTFDNDDLGIGIDLGCLVVFNNDKRFSYGFKLINTFSTKPNGGILQSGIFFRYNL